jgi:hypothetical protein
MEVKRLNNYFSSKKKNLERKFQRESKEGELMSHKEHSTSKSIVGQVLQICFFKNE